MTVRLSVALHQIAVWTDGGLGHSLWSDILVQSVQVVDTLAELVGLHHVEVLENPLVGYVSANLYIGVANLVWEL